MRDYTNLSITKLKELTRNDMLAGLWDCGRTRSLDVAVRNAQLIAKQTKRPVVIYEGARGYGLCLEYEYYAQEDRDDLKVHVYPNGLVHHYLENGETDYGY